MSFQLTNIVPWGRSLSEYTAMFDLTENDLQKRILGCADGPASFNAELTRRGGSIVSVDPFYAYDTDEIARRIEETFTQILEQTRKNREEFVWTQISSVEELGRIRMQAMQAFLADFPLGKTEGRYIAEALPYLDFPATHFNLAVVSHFLFLYSTHLDLDFHIEAIAELCRVSEEVRIFPLLQLGATPSPHVKPVCDYFRAEDYVVTISTVPYEFQRGGDQMLTISRYRQ